MGDHQGWLQPSGLLPNGLLFNESASVIRAFDAERWSKAEERTAELIACIQPNQPSEERRNAVADYVQRLIMKCFPCQVFTFGSVPLKTYLPDGDIDLTAFSENQNLKDKWANQVRDILESEEKNENAEFRVKEVQYIQAEVKIIKCLVENIVVDISFNQLGGLCTLCFLEEVDLLINQDHLFKRSIILIKAWCYYESRILGAHHGLISTYALETLVLYIFHVFNNSFAGPLEVLYRFLEFFSNFDWDKFCLSLWGPVPISSLPAVTAEPPRKDGGELLLSKLFLDTCSSMYAVLPGGYENQGQPFISKHFNVIDPLRVNNNLGRSVSRGNFYRIRSAFAYGVKRLARLLNCPKESIDYELNQFFINTWKRHGSGVRPDASMGNSLHLRPLNQVHASDNYWHTSNNKKMDKNAFIEEIKIKGPESPRSLFSQHVSYPSETTSKGHDSCMQGAKSSGNPNYSRMLDQTEKGSSNHSAQIDRSHRNRKPNHMVNEAQGKHLFARTRSSPELTNAYCDASSRAKHNKLIENRNTQVASGKMDGNRRKTLVSETGSTQSALSSSDDPSSDQYIYSNRMLESASASTSMSTSHVDDSVIAPFGGDHASVMGVQGMRLEEQDFVNIMASSSVNNFGERVLMPMNVDPTQLPLPIAESVMSSMGYPQRSMPGMVPANIPLIDPHWPANLQFQYLPGFGLSMKSEHVTEQGDENFRSIDLACRDADTDSCHGHDVASNSGFAPDNGSLEMLHADDRQPSTSASSNSVPCSRTGGSGNSVKAQKKFTKDNRGSRQDVYSETLRPQDKHVSESYSDDTVFSARYPSALQSSSVRSKTSSESSWDGSSAGVSKVTRDKWGRKTVTPTAVPPTAHGKGKNVYELATAEADDDSSEWNTFSTTGDDTDERKAASQWASTLQLSMHPGFEGLQTSGPDSIIPIASVLLGPTSRQRVTDNSGFLPFAFYLTAQVPFLTMFPINLLTESGTSDALSSHLGREEDPDNSDSGRNFDSSEGHVAPHVVNAYNNMTRATLTESSREPKCDILNNDLASHRQNLQYGRFCQSPRFPAPVICPSPVVVPPSHLQGRFPWDGPGRPLANVNLLSQLMSYGPRIVPFSPPQAVPNRPTSVYQRYADELPKHRSGTGTYLPNLASIRNRHSSETRRNNYNSDRSDRGDRDENWNTAKSRASACGHNQSQAEKSRIDRLATNENHLADRPWGAFRHEPLPSFQSQNGPVLPTSSQSSSVNVAYGMYQLPGMHQSGVTSNGSTIPSVVMLYPYDHNSGYVSPGEQFDFGSLGPVGFVGMNDGSLPADGTNLRGPIEDQGFYGSSTQRSSPDEPSSPHFQRRI